MLKKKCKKLFAFALAMVMTLSVMFSLMSVSAFAVTQSEIDALKSQRSELRDQKSGVQSTINSLQGQQSDQIALKNALDEKNAITVKQILNLTEQIDLHTTLIEQKTVEVEEAQKVADEQLEKYKVRVRAMEESGRYNYFEVLFGANSIGEFLSLIDDIGDIMKSDKELEDPTASPSPTLRPSSPSTSRPSPRWRTPRRSLRLSRCSRRRILLRLTPSSPPFRGR